MLNFDGDGHGDGDVVGVGTCKQALTGMSQTSLLPITYEVRGKLMLSLVCEILFTAPPPTKVRWVGTAKPNPPSGR